MNAEDEEFEGFRVDDLVIVKERACIGAFECKLELCSGWVGEVIGFYDGHVRVRLTEGAPGVRGIRQHQSGTIDFLPQFLRVTGHKSPKVTP